MATTITTRVEDILVKDIDKIAQEEALDRSSIIRRFLIKALKEWKIQKFLGI
jgi:metal-responsive CopG/Arc/MetJ family transcriptional regulator